jgi:hypothetical protein
MDEGEASPTMLYCTPILSTMHFPLNLGLLVDSPGLSDLKITDAQPLNCIEPTERS